MKFLELSILTLFDSIITLLFIHNIIKALNNSVYRKFSFIFCNCFLSTFIMINVDDRIVANVLCTVILFIFINIYLYRSGEKKLIKNFFIFIVNTTLIIVVQLIVVLFLNGLLKNLQYSFWNGFIAQFIGLTVVLIAVRLVPFSFINVLLEEKNIVFRVLTSGIFIVHYTVTILWIQVEESLQRVWFGMGMVIIFAVVTITLIIREGYLKNSFEQRMKMQEMYFPIIDEMIMEIRHRQHDYHNQIQTILSMKMNNEISENMIKEYANSLVKPSSVILTSMENRIVAAFLHSKIIEANNKGIKVKVESRGVLRESSYETYEIIEMYGIILDNAIQAVEEDEHYTEIEIIMDKDEDQSIFEVRNDYKYISTREIQSFFKSGFSKKSSKTRGIGLYKLKKIKDKRGGTIDFYYDTEIKKVVVSLRHK